MCKSDASSPIEISTSSSAEGDCKYQIDLQSSKGCAVFSLSQLSQFLDKYKHFWGAAIIVLGVFLAVIGNKFVNAVLFIISSLAGFAAAVTAEFWILDKASDNDASDVV